MPNWMNAGRRPIPLVRGILGLAFALVVTPVACNAPPGEPQSGSNSNWLHACQTAADCAVSNACTCGGCTVPCASDTDCTRLADAHCALSSEASSWSACQTAQPNLTGLCLPNCDSGSCDANQACVSNACVLLNLPESAFCTPVVNPPLYNRTHEDELLALLQQSRVSGGVACGAAAMPVQPALRLDARLTCAARVLAADLAASGARSLTDSQGRTTTARLALAGYAQSAWAEGFALAATTAAAAYSNMLGDTQVCSQVQSGTYLDVGIGVSGTVYVVTLAAP